MNVKNSELKEQTFYPYFITDGLCKYKIPFNILKDLKENVETFTPILTGGLS